MHDEPMLDYVLRKLHEVKFSRWDAIAAAINEAPLREGAKKMYPKTIRKIAYRERKDPGAGTLQPLYDFFRAVDRGERELPELVTADEQESGE